MQRKSPHFCAYG